MTHILGESVGIELEIEDILANEIGIYEFERKHDASCETNCIHFNGIRVFKPNDLLVDNLRNATFGTELVSIGTINTETPDYLKKLKSLTQQINILGESPRSYRAGFHVHVSCPLNLRIAKSIIRLSRNLEQVFYLIGCMGYDFRGKKNNSTYCRPITKKGPAIVPGNRDKFYPCMVLNDLLKSRTLAEFQTCYGDLIGLLGGTHYIPIRYHFINLVPLWTQGSLEFRVFNKSTNPYYLKAAIEFCKAFTKLAVESSFDSLKEEGFLQENSVFDVKGESDRQKIIDTFQFFINKADISDEDVEILIEILNISDIDSIVLPDEYTFTHLMFHSGGNRSPIHWSRTNSYRPKEINSNEVVKPLFMDVHNMRNNNTIDEPMNLEERRRLEELRIRIREGRNPFVTTNMTEIFEVPSIERIDDNEEEESDDFFDDEMIEEEE